MNTEAVARLREVERQRDRLAAEVHVLGEREGADLCITQAELASARVELEQLRAARSWEVARQEVGPCALCGQPMVRSQGVKPMPGTTRGMWAHVECPNPPDPGVLAAEVELRRQVARVRALTCHGVDLYDRPGSDTVTVDEIRAALDGEAVRG